MHWIARSHLVHVKKWLTADSTALVRKCRTDISTPVSNCPDNSDPYRWCQRVLGLNCLGSEVSVHSDPGLQAIQFDKRNWNPFYNESNKSNTVMSRSDIILKYFTKQYNYFPLFTINTQQMCPYNVKVDNRIFGNFCTKAGFWTI